MERMTRIPGLQTSTRGATSRAVTPAYCGSLQAAVGGGHSMKRVQVGVDVE